MPSLRKVDKLRVSFLVDNTIEWMTRLPPGFTHELQQQISLRPEPDKVTGVPVLDFDNFCCGAHGFAALIVSSDCFKVSTAKKPMPLADIQETEVDGSRSYTLFDTGPDNLSLARNLVALQTPAAQIERVIISHWHRDHTGGLLSFLKYRQKSSPSGECIVDVHPDRPHARGIAPGPNYDKVVCALPADPTFEEITAARGVIEKNNEGHAVAQGTVWVSGEIPRVTEYEQGILGGVRWVEEEGKGSWVKEQHIMDERYAAIDVVGKGLVIFSACSHAGIVNVVRDAISVFSRPIYMIIGGLHLAGPEFSVRIDPTVEFLSKTLRPSPTYILPMHCSGFQSKIALERAFGEGCVPAGVGHKFEIAGDRVLDERLMEPVVPA